MLPSFKPGDRVLVDARSPAQEGDAIALQRSGSDILLLKRIEKIQDSKYFVLGDNQFASTDSGVFGFITKQEILGRVIAKY